MASDGSTRKRGGRNGLTQRRPDRIPEMLGVGAADAGSRGFAEKLPDEDDEPESHGKVA